MKKIPTLLTGFLLLTILLHAQQKEHKFLAELSIGPSFPIGKFGEKTYNGTDAEAPGFAKIGVGANLSLGYHLNESVGLLLTGGYSIFSQDEQAYEAYTKSTNSNVTRADIDAENWKIAKLMAGGFLVTPLTQSEELVLITKITAGVCKTAVPKFSYIAFGSGPQSDYWSSGGMREKMSLPWSFCYQVSVGVKYKLGNRLHALLDVNSFNATAKKDYAFYHPVQLMPDFSSVPTPPPGVSEKKFKLASVNVVAGIGISF